MARLCAAVFEGNVGGEGGGWCLEGIAAFAAQASAFGPGLNLAVKQYGTIDGMRGTIATR